MNIASFRRRTSAPKPLTVMRELYYGYSCLTSCRTKRIMESDQEFKLLRTNSAEHMTKYLQRVQRVQASQQSTSLLQTDSKQSDSSRLQKRGCLIKQPLYFGSCLNDPSKRSYFKRSYTKSHSFFKKHSRIVLAEVSRQSARQIVQILPQIYQKSNTKLLSPRERREQVSHRLSQMRQLRAMLHSNQQIKKDLQAKLRYNSIVYRNYLEKESQCSASNKGDMSYQPVTVDIPASRVKFGASTVNKENLSALLNMPGASTVSVRPNVQITVFA